MIRNYPITLSVDYDNHAYTLMLGGDAVASVTPDEPVSGLDALRLLLGVEKRTAFRPPTPEELG